MRGQNTQRLSMNEEIVKIKSKQEAQVFSEFLKKEAHRHAEDIFKIFDDLDELEKKWGVRPRGKYIGKWIVP